MFKQLVESNFKEGIIVYIKKNKIILCIVNTNDNFPIVTHKEKEILKMLKYDVDVFSIKEIRDFEKLKTHGKIEAYFIEF